MSIISVEQIAYSEYTNAISNPAFLNIVDVSPLNGQILIDMSTIVAYTIRLFVNIWGGIFLNPAPLLFLPLFLCYD